MLCGLQVLVRLLELIELEQLVDEGLDSTDFKGAVHVRELLLVAYDVDARQKLSNTRAGATYRQSYPERQRHCTAASWPDLNGMSFSVA